MLRLPVKMREEDSVSRAVIGVDEETVPLRMRERERAYAGRFLRATSTPLTYMTTPSREYTPNSKRG